MFTRLARYQLHATVFLTGAAVLIIEVAAVRVLAPFFGNTIFSFSSVIGVILAALSAGYWFGGRFADRHPKEAVFFLIIAFAGITTLALYATSFLVLPAAAVFSFTYGPLFASLILFFAPAFLLGTLSPYAVKLSTLIFPDKGIGGVSGEIFFWSTLGSITGTLLAGFYLIPRIGVNEIVIGIGVFLVALGASGLVGRTGQRKHLLRIVTATVFFTTLNAVFLNTIALANTVYDDDGMYERIRIVDRIYNERPARLLYQDRNLSAGIFLSSEKPAFDYMRFFTDAYPFFVPGPDNALFIGGGAYILPKELLDREASIAVDVVEVEPSLIDIAHTYFGLPEDERLANHIMDGRVFLKQSSKNYDLILSDVYSNALSIPPHFTTQEFFELAKDRLSPNGVFMANIIGSLEEQTPSFLYSEMKTFRSVFPRSFFFAVEATDTDTVQNVMFMGIRGGDTPSPRANMPAVPKEVREKLVDPAEDFLDDHILLTDNYAPVEYLTAQDWRRYFDRNNK